MRIGVLRAIFCALCFTRWGTSSACCPCDDSLWVEAGWVAKEGTIDSIQHVPSLFVAAVRRQPAVEQVFTMRADPSDRAGEPETWVTFVKVPSLESAVRLLYEAQMASQGEARVGFQFADLLHELPLSSSNAELIKSAKVLCCSAIYQEMAVFNTLLNEVAKLRRVQGEKQPMMAFRRATGALPCLIALTSEENPHQPGGDPFASNPRLGKVKSSLFRVVAALSFAERESCEGRDELIQQDP